ncbi:unnamed protein product, partial [Closterium sp. Naga37s-1]
FIFVGIAVQLTCLKLGWAPWRGTDLNDEALFLLINQSVRTASGIAIVWFVARPFNPLSTDLFHWGFEDPFSCRKGWLSWAGVGVLTAGLVVFATATATTALSGGIDPPREDADALVQVLPIIAASPFSTGALIFVAGVLAPILEETIFRAFLLTSLTKWMPVPLAVAGSACAFAAAHMTPNKLPVSSCPLPFFSPSFHQDACSSGGGRMPVPLAVAGSACAFAAAHMTPNKLPVSSCPLPFFSPSFHQDACSSGGGRMPVPLAVAGSACAFAAAHMTPNKLPVSSCPLPFFSPSFHQDACSSGGGRMPVLLAVAGSACAFAAAHMTPNKLPVSSCPLPFFSPSFHQDACSSGGGR